MPENKSLPLGFRGKHRHNVALTQVQAILVRHFQTKHQREAWLIAANNVNDRNLSFYPQPSLYISNEPHMVKEFQDSSYKKNPRTKNNESTLPENKTNDNKNANKNARQQTKEKTTQKQKQTTGHRAPIALEVQKKRKATGTNSTLLKPLFTIVAPLKTFDAIC